MPAINSAKNREYVYRSRAKAIAEGRCKNCFQPREADRQDKTMCLWCAKKQTFMKSLRLEKRRG